MPPLLPPLPPPPPGLLPKINAIIFWYHCQQCWLGWLHPSLHRMQPSNSNSGTGPPSESRTDSNSVAKRQGHRIWIGQQFTRWPGAQ
ncbi:hypothetical protein PCASD_08717 [Puccinia coronata f. sp. avenae]|uniref:Uncharacterized protein n=1 Tax=Puccinia coronata f. sp. avenae TaxID=200324 RepID=A0A2N5UG48_9BASI|nr:hypothetical protein PCASD_08717 [Puccinia coronata f. sp. avenae]